MYLMFAFTVSVLYLCIILKGRVNFTFHGWLLIEKNNLEVC